MIANIIKAQLLTLFLSFFITVVGGQSLEVVGEAKISQMQLKNMADSLVVRLADGTLAVREVTSLPGSGWILKVDTTSTMKKVGIGTSSPVTRLNIVGPQANPLIPGSTSNGILRIGVSSGEALDIGKINGGTFDAWLQAGFNGTTADPISLQPLGGNVGIGLISPSEKLEVAGNVKVAGIISGVVDPVSAQDAATKAYVDLLESKVELLLNILVDNDIFYVQQKLDLGETPKQIYDSDNSLLDSLYGKTYQGGLIAYLNTTTGNGLLAAQVDQSTGAEWGCNGVYIRGTSGAIGTGQANTTLIVDGCAEAGIAARLCNDLSYDGYDDWFLPSRDELNQLYVNLKLNDFGGFGSGIYWSSTEDEFNWAWVQDFLNGSQYLGVDKFNNNNVRAVRVF